jgi:hypothetical protein
MKFTKIFLKESKQSYAIYIFYSDFFKGEYLFESWTIFSIHEHFLNIQETISKVWTIFVSDELFFHNMNLLLTSADNFEW